VANTNPMNFRIVRQLLAVKGIRVADASGVNRSRLSLLETGLRDPTKAEDLTLRAVLLKVAVRRRQEIEAAIMWLQSREPQTWALDRETVAAILEGRETAAESSA
jgi:transcriptional regulator with XRE-family HTH domain